MARRRSPTGQLSRLLATTRNPVYVVAVSGELLYANEACADWCELTVEQLVGADCHANTDTALGLMGLAPPPHIWSERVPAWSTVVPPTANSAGRPRVAFFIPLTGEGNAVDAVLAVAHTGNSDQRDSWPPPTTTPEATVLRAALQQLRHKFQAEPLREVLAGESANIRRVRRQIQLAGQHRMPVLVHGPAGSGRQTVARAIHFAGPKNETGPIVPLACGLLGHDMLLSTFRALRERDDDRAPHASTITVLLRDVDQLSLDLQREILDIADSPHPVWRVMATTSRELPALAASREFLPSLADSLSTAVITIPNLRERQEDLPLIVQAMVEQANHDRATPLSGFTQEAMDQLVVYPWPGEMRELAQLVRNSCDQAEGPFVEVSDLPERIHHARLAAEHPPRPVRNIDLEEVLRDVEREIIRRALRIVGGNKAKAAKMLGMTRPRLYRRLEQIGLPTDE